MNDQSNTSALTHDDIPEEFTLEGLRAHFSDEEIAEMNEGDDPLLPGVDLSATGTAQDDDTAGDDTVPPVVDEKAAEQDPTPPVMVDVSAHEATVAELDTKIDQLQEKYDDGDLTSAEYKAQLSAVVKEQAVAQAALNAATQQVESGFKTYRDSWFAKVGDYQSKHAYLAEPEHFDNWDAALKMVNGNTAYENLTMGQKIEQAHRIYAAHYEGIEGKSLPTKPGLTATQKAEVKAEAEQAKLRTDQRPAAPTTLADLTNAGDGGFEDGRFAQIDRVSDQDPMKGEALFSQMSEADQIAYLAGN